MVKRVSRKQVVKPAPTVISKKSADAVFMKDNPEVVFIEDGDFSSFKYLSGAFSGISGSGTIVPSVSVNATPTAVVPQSPIIKVDVPNLMDIEKIDYEEYADPVTGVSKYRAILKIRNNSSDKSSVSGVDARIYNPNSPVTYTLGAVTATGTGTGSTFASTVTWYKATTVYNPFEGSIISGPSADGTATYLADGSNVPKDAIVGTSTNIRTKSVWRKTLQEALAAAAVSI